MMTLERGETLPCLSGTVQGTLKFGRHQYSSHYWATECVEFFKPYSLDMRCLKVIQLAPLWFNAHQALWPRGGGPGQQILWILERHISLCEMAPGGSLISLRGIKLVSTSVHEPHFLIWGGGERLYCKKPELRSKFATKYKSTKRKSTKHVGSSPIFFSN